MRISGWMPKVWRMEPCEEGNHGERLGLTKETVGQRPGQPWRPGGRKWQVSKFPIAHNYGLNVKSLGIVWKVSYLCISVRRKAHE